MPIRMQFKVSEKNMLLSGIGRCRANTLMQEEAHISLLRCLLWTWKVCEWHMAPPLGCEVEWSGGRCVPAIIKYFLACWALSKAGNRHLVENQTDVVPMFMSSPSACPWYVCVCVCVCVSPHKHTCMLGRWRGCFRSRVNGFQVESVTTVIDLTHITTKLTILEYNFACPQGIPQWSAVKESTWNAGDAGLIPGLGRSPGEGDGNSLQYSCLGNPMNRGAWWATVHGVAESWTQLSD